MRVVFDTYAWIEYFLGTNKGRKVERIIEENEVLTPIIVLVELSCKSVREGWNFNRYLGFIKANSLTIGIDDNLLFSIGKIYTRMREKIRDFGLVDSIILTVSEAENAKVVTGDRHFKGLRDVIFLA